jgi:hypothetical protein
VHRHSIDAWRFYPDAGHALELWAQLQAMPCLLLESFIAAPGVFGWRDFVAVFCKTSLLSSDHHPRRICHALEGHEHGYVLEPGARRGELHP